jgi:hypothetical protein
LTRLSNSGKKLNIISSCRISGTSSDKHQTNPKTCRRFIVEHFPDTLHHYPEFSPSRIIRLEQIDNDDITAITLNVPSIKFYNHLPQQQYFVSSPA